MTEEGRKRVMKASTNKVDVKCAVCGGTFQTTEFSKTNALYCGPECRNVAYKIRKKKQRIEKAMNEELHIVRKAKTTTLQDIDYGRLLANNIIELEVRMI